MDADNSAYVSPNPAICIGCEFDNVDLSFLRLVAVIRHRLNFSHLLLTMAYALTGRLLYGNISVEEIRIRATAGRTDKAFSNGLDHFAARSPWSGAVVRLIRNCLDKNPRSRPDDGMDLYTAAAAVAHVAKASHNIAKLGQPTLDRMMARFQMREMAKMLNEHHGGPLDERAVVALRRLSRIQPTSQYLRSGVAPAVLHGTFMTPYAEMGNTSAWDMYRSPRR